jgi:adenylyltransferase/sulfurtransferase
MEKIVLEETKYDRAERITWWNQEKLRAARVLVVGAGALGNEIVKNITLIGVGHCTLVDMDSIEFSNLSRGVFFREGDEGKFKSQIVATRAMELNPDIEINPLTCSVQSLGDAFLAKFDLIIAGLDNREARVWIGAAAQRAGVVWIDAAIEGLQGKVQTFVPGGACYACTLNESDWKIISYRRACSLLGIDEILSGHVPTNATTSSIIAGVQAQEAVKYLVGHDRFYALENKMWSMFGEDMTTFKTDFAKSDECPYHYDVVKVTEPLVLKDTLLATFGDDKYKVISFFDDVILISGCSSCKSGRKFGFKDLMKKQGTCDKCGAELQIDLYSRFAGDDECLKIELNPDFWPQTFFGEVEYSTNLIKSISINKESHGHD